MLAASTPSAPLAAPADTDPVDIEEGAREVGENADEDAMEPHGPEVIDAGHAQDLGDAPMAEPLPPPAAEPEAPPAAIAEAGVLAIPPAEARPADLEQPFDLARALGPAIERSKHMDPNVAQLLAIVANPHSQSDASIGESTGVDRRKVPKFAHALANACIQIQRHRVEYVIGMLTDEVLGAGGRALIFIESVRADETPLKGKADAAASA